MVAKSPDAVLRCWRLRVEKDTPNLEENHLGNGGLTRHSSTTPFSECTDGEDTRGMRDECESSSGNCIMSIGISKNNGTKEEKVAMQNKINASTSHEVDHSNKPITTNCMIEFRKEKQVGLFKDDSMVIVLVDMNDLADPKAYLWIGERVPESTAVLATCPRTLNELSRRIAQRCCSAVHQNSPIEIMIVYQSQEPQEFLRAFNICKCGWGILFTRERTSNSPYRVIELVEKHGVAVALELVRNDRIGVISKDRTSTCTLIPFPSKMKSYIVVQGPRPVYMWHSSEESTSVKCLGRHICENAAWLLQQQNPILSSSSKEKSGKKSKRKKAVPELLHLWGGEASVSLPPPKIFWEAMGLEEECGFPMEEPCLATTLKASDYTDIATECSSHQDTYIDTTVLRDETSMHQPFQGKTGDVCTQENSPGEDVTSCRIIESVSSHVQGRGTQQPLALEVNNVIDDHVEKMNEVKSSNTTMDMGDGSCPNHTVYLRNRDNSDICVDDAEGTQFLGGTLDEYVVNDYIDIISSESVTVNNSVDNTPKRVTSTATVECGVNHDSIRNVVSNVEQQHKVVDEAVACLDDSHLKSCSDAIDTESSALKMAELSVIGIETAQRVVNSKVMDDAIDLNGVSVNLDRAEIQLSNATPNELHSNTTSIGCSTDTTTTTTTTGMDGQKGELGSISVADGTRRCSSGLSSLILEEFEDNPDGVVMLNEIQQLPPQPPKCEEKRGTISVLVKGQHADASSNAISSHCGEPRRPHFLLDVVKNHYLLDVSKCKALSSNVHEMVEDIGTNNNIMLNNKVSGVLTLETGSRLRDNGGRVQLQPSGVNTVATINLVSESEHEVERTDICQDSVNDDGVGMRNGDQQLLLTQNEAPCDNESSAVMASANALEEQLESIRHPMQDDKDHQNEVSVSMRNSPAASTKKSPSKTEKTTYVKNHEDFYIVHEIPDPILNNSPPDVPKMSRRGSNSAVERARALADIDRCRREEQRVLNSNGLMDQVQNLVARIIGGGGEGSCVTEEREGHKTISQNHETHSRKGSSTHDSETILDIRSEITPVKASTALSRRTSAVYHSPAPLTPTPMDLNFSDTKPTIWEAWNPGRSDLKVPLPATLPEIPGSFQLFLDWQKICCAQGFGC